MATMFTGLKLQGELGKFSKVDLCDIKAFAELPDGTFVSGSESGHLLLWEDSFLKCRFITTYTTSIDIGSDDDDENLMMKQTSLSQQEQMASFSSGIMMPLLIVEEQQQIKNFLYKNSMG
eukprot:10673736-Ditylum_brightwellii.AAC.1